MIDIFNPIRGSDTGGHKACLGRDLATADIDLGVDTTAATTANSCAAPREIPRS